MGGDMVASKKDNSDKRPLKFRSAEFKQQKTANYRADHQPWRFSKSCADETHDRFRTLPPIPAASRAEARFRREV